MAEYHVRLQRPDERTTVLSFIDADANRITYRQFFDLLERSEPFRTVFLGAIADVDASTFVWEMPAVGPTSLAGEVECAVTSVPAPPRKKLRIDPDTYAPHVRPDELAVALASPDGDGQLVVPCPREAEGWYADLGTFVRRVRAEQVHALFRAFARLAKASVASQTVYPSSSVPGAPWLHLRVGVKPRKAAYARYGR